MYETQGLRLAQRTRSLSPHLKITARCLSNFHKFPIISNIHISLLRPGHVFIVMEIRQPFQEKLPLHQWLGKLLSKLRYTWFCPYLGGHSTFDRWDSLTPPSKRSLREIPRSHMKSGKRLILEAGKSTVKRRVCHMSPFNLIIIAKNFGYCGCKIVLSPSEVVLKRKL